MDINDQWYARSIYFDSKYLEIPQFLTITTMFDTWMDDFSLEELELQYFI